MAEELGRQIALQAALLAEADARRLERRVVRVCMNDGVLFAYWKLRNRNYHVSLNDLFEVHGWMIDRDNTSCLRENTDLMWHGSEKNNLVLIRKKPAAA